MNTYNLRNIVFTTIYPQIAEDQVMCYLDSSSNKKLSRIETISYL